MNDYCTSHKGLKIAPMEKGVSGSPQISIVLVHCSNADPTPLPADSCEFVLCISESVSVLLVCLFSLDKETPIGLGAPLTSSYLTLYLCTFFMLPLYLLLLK